MRPNLSRVLFLVLLGASPASAREGDKGEGWINLFGADGSDLSAFRSPTGAWRGVAEVGLDPSNPKKIAVTKEGRGAIYNGPLGKTLNLTTKQKFGDVEVHLEFLVPKGSNSGIKLQEVYEIQIYDSYGVKKLTASHSGGVYHRAELLPRYHHIDDGYPPKTNAALPPGEWQTLDIVWLSPKFDAEGKKTSNAKFEKVLLNGKVVQENLEVPCPTGHNWRNKETPTGAIFLQADHGPVAFRNLKVRELAGSAKR